MSIAYTNGRVEMEWVDLGLPSGLLWASCNLGATAPEAYGDYYAWGETAPKDFYGSFTYKYGTYAMGDVQFLTKYNSRDKFGISDNLSTLEAMDDAATVMLGTSARMPTSNEWCELLNNTESKWTTLNGVNGRLFTAANGKSLFLPAAGDRSGSSLNLVGISGNYWSSSLDTGCPNNPNGAWCFCFGSADVNHLGSWGYRGHGLSIRAVRQN